MNEREQLIRVCEGIGASPQQAGTIADQLIKRCDQLVASRGVSREEAMTYLLNLVVKGAAGETPPGFEATTPPPPPEGAPPETR